MDLKSILIIITSAVMKDNSQIYMYSLPQICVLTLSDTLLHSSHLVLLGDLSWISSAISLVQLSGPLVDLGEDRFPPRVSFGQLLSSNLPSFLGAYSSVKGWWQYLA